MDERTRHDLEAMEKAFASMIARSERVMGKFAQGTAQHTLLRNRIRALRIASALVSGEDAVAECSAEALEAVRAPIVSLISKSEKAQLKLQEDTWQHAMLEDNLFALKRALEILRDFERRRGSAGLMAGAERN